MNLPEEITQRLIQQMSDKLDDKLKEACLIWGVNVDDPEEMKRRCKLSEHAHNDRIELTIDDHLVMIFKPWKLDPPTMTMPVKISVSFQCSEIIEPVGTFTINNHERNIKKSIPSKAVR